MLGSTEQNKFRPRKSKVSDTIASRSRKLQGCNPPETARSLDVRKGPTEKETMTAFFRFPSRGRRLDQLGARALHARQPPPCSSCSPRAPCRSSLQPGHLLPQWCLHKGGWPLRPLGVLPSTGYQRRFAPLQRGLRTGLGNLGQPGDEFSQEE
jgi:hypothetical protein